MRCTLIGYRALVGLMTHAILVCSVLGPLACATVIAPSSGADVLVTQEQAGTTITVSVGQTLSIDWPNADRWRVSFDSPPLQLVGQSDQGWRLRVISAGNTTVVITFITASDAPPSQFVFIVHATA